MRHLLDDALGRANSALQRLGARGGVGTGELTALADAVEELGVAFEELRAQNDELTSLHEALANERSRWERLFTHAPEVYLITDARGVVIDANLQALSLFGMTARQLRGVPITTRVPFSERPAFRRLLLRAGRAGARGEWQSWIQPQDADRRAVNIQVVVDPPQGTGRPELGWIIHDIDELVERSARLQEAFNEEQQRSANLQDINRWKTSLLRASAHDVRQPLHAIIGAADTLLSAPADVVRDRTTELLEMISRNGRHLDSLMTDLIELDRLTGSNVRLQRETVSLPELVRGIVDVVDTSDRLVSLVLPPCTANVGRVEFERIVENLLRNAVAHTGPGTPIWVSLEPGPAAVQLTVADAGPGVLPKDRERIFAPFEQASTTGGGSGLGLSLVRLFAELHGGSVVVTDRPGGGASFRVSLPARSEDPVPATLAATAGAATQ